MEYMTSKERMGKAIELEEPDRVPVFITALSHPSRVVGVRISEMRGNPEIAAEAAVKTSQKYETDCVYSYQDYGLLLGDIEDIQVDVPLDSPPRIGGHPLRTARNGDYDIPEFPLMSDRRNRNLQVLFRTAERTCTLAGGNTFCCFCVAGPFTLAALLRGVENFCLDLLDAPDRARGLIAACAQFSLETLVGGIECGATMASIADPTASPNLISPTQFRYFAGPYLKFVIEGLHDIFPDKPIPVRLHICGNTTVIHDQMVGTGADILSLDQAVDLKRAKEILGKKVCLMGNVDPSKLYSGTASEIEEISRKCIEDAKEGGGFVLASGCEIPPDCSAENLRTLIHSARAYGMY
jgi:uroporphyrinogen decarboxylase